MPISVLAVVAAATWLPACSDTPEPAARPALLPPPAETSGCDERGYLRTTLYGEHTVAVDWSADELDCAGMPRPEGEGARLRFAGKSGEQSIAIIIAMPGLERGGKERELGSNVTIIEEGSGRFFSTSGLGSCWTDIIEQRDIDESADTFFIAGTLYCISPLSEVNGSSSVTVRELLFGGVLDWGAK